MSRISDQSFIETTEYRRFVEFCDACSHYRYIGLCYGAPGVGKTLSARRFTNWDMVAACDLYDPSSNSLITKIKGCNAVLYTPRVVTGRSDVAKEVAMLREKLLTVATLNVHREEDPLVIKEQFRLDKEQDLFLTKGDWFSGPSERIAAAQERVKKAVNRRKRRLQRTKDPTRLILVDEADRLKMTGLEQAREVFDEGGVGLVLIGMPGLEKRLARYPQLYSRVGFVHNFRPISEGEARKLLIEGWSPPGAKLPRRGLYDDETLAAILRITGGNFRLLDRLLTQVGRILHINSLQQVTCQVVEAARETLVIGAA